MNTNEQIPVDIGLFVVTEASRMSNHNDHDSQSDGKHNDSAADKSDEGVELPVPLSVDADSPMPPPPFGMLGRFLQFMSHANDTTASVTDGETATTTESNMSPESMLAEVSNIFSTMMDTLGKMPQFANLEAPTAGIPSDVSKATRPVTNGPVYNVMDNTKDSAVDMLNMVKDSFSMMDRISGHLSGPPTSSPQTSNTPATSPLSSILAAISASPIPDADNNARNAQGLPSPRDNLAADSLKAIARVYQTNELVVRTTIQKLYAHLVTVPEDDDSYPFIQSIIGLNLLHLYEVTWDNGTLEAGCDGTSLALQRLFQLPELRRVQLTPTIVRCWAYGQRMLVRKYGDVDKLEAALAILKQTWSIYRDLPGIPSRVIEFLRTELGICLADHFRCTGNLDSLNDAIDHLLALTEDEETPSPTTAILGLAYYDRFMYRGVLDDLDRALRRGQMSCDFMSFELPSSGGQAYDADTAAGHHLFSLALAERFKMTMDVDDLDKAVKHCIKATKLLHPSHPSRVLYTVDLATILYARHLTAVDGSGDIHTALEYIQSAMVAVAEDIGRHSRVPADSTIGFLTAVAAEEQRNVSEVETGITYIQRSRKNFSGPPHLESRIENYLSKALLCRFRLGKNVEDFELSIHHAQLALSKGPEDSPYRFQCGLDLGRLLLKQYDCGQSDTCDDAIAQFVSIAMSSTWPSIRLQGAIEWANAAEASNSDGAGDALLIALEIFPTLASISSRIPAQYRFLSSQTASIPNRAAIYALDSNDVAGAVSRLEQGRNIMWAQSLQLQAGHMLPAGDERQREFKLLSEHLSNTRHGPMIPKTMEEMEEFMKHLPPNPVAATLNDSIAKFLGDVMRKLVELGDRSRVTKDLGMIDNFKDEFRNIYMDASLHSSANRWTTLHSERRGLEDMLTFSEADKEDLLPILVNGSIIIITSYALRCDAIVISSKEEDLDFHHLPLPDLSGDEIQAWAETLRLGTHDFEQGELPLAEFESEYLNPILRGLWKGLALPLLDYLKGVGEKRRIWWYPTGPLMFLPIHAASTCEGDEPGLLDLLISSYIPSLRSLVRAAKSPPSPVKVLAVGLPNTAGHAPLKFVDKEIRALRKHFYHVPDALTTLIGEEADIYPVISKLPEHTCIHLSCHAYQDEEYPFNSALFLHNGKLKLSKLMALDLSHVQFAFLSACLTSAGDTSLPDECIHLAAGMQFAGVRSVIGTMWSVMDRAAAAAATKVYSHLFRNGVENANMGEGAEALHEAIIEMKNRKLPLTYIVPFIHLGL